VTLERTRDALARAGLNLTGTLPVEEYDRLVPSAWRAHELCPDCAGVVLVGNGGRALWPLFKRSPEARLRRDPLDRYTERVLSQVCLIAGPGTEYALYNAKRDGQYLPLVRLAERAGFGSRGRVGVLLHPEYGPWTSIRGVLYMTRAVPFQEPAPFDPCTGCPAPCAEACHGAAVEPDGVDIAGCFRTRVLDRRCRSACDARSACVLGPEHAFTAEQIAHHSRIRWRPATIRRAARVVLRGLVEPPRRSAGGRSPAG
jgi:hypothetical protein